MNATTRILALEEAGRRLAAATHREQTLEDGRAAEKAAAIGRLMQGTNGLTGKPHSASSAEAVVETDADYAGYRRAQADAVQERIFARTAYDAAHLNAQLAIALAGAERRVYIHAPADSPEGF